MRILKQRPQPWQLGSHATWSRSVSHRPNLLVKRGEPTFSEILPSLIFWLDEWLDKNSCGGLADVRFEASDGNVSEVRRETR